MFSFPTDNVTREKWFRAIPRRREDYEMNIRLRVFAIVRFLFNCIFLISLQLYLLIFYLILNFIVIILISFWLLLDLIVE